MNYSYYCPRFFWNNFYSCPRFYFFFEKIKKIMRIFNEIRIKSLLKFSRTIVPLLILFSGLRPSKSLNSSKLFKISRTIVPLLIIFFDHLLWCMVKSKNFLKNRRVFWSFCWNFWKFVGSWSKFLKKTLTKNKKRLYLCKFKR